MSGAPASPATGTTTRTFKLPDVGEGLTEAEVVRWLVAEGEVVAVNAPIVEIETAKSLVELPSPWAGRVEALLVHQGTHAVELRVVAWPAQVFSPQGRTRGSGGVP